jgi:hypothetical protein
MAQVHAQVGIYYCPWAFDAAVGGGTHMIFTINPALRHPHQTTS